MFCVLSYSVSCLSDLSLYRVPVCNSGPPNPADFDLMVAAMQVVIVIIIIIIIVIIIIIIWEGWVTI